MEARVLLVPGSTQPPASWIDALGAAGAKVRVIPDAEAAIRHLEVLDPDVVLLDSELPGPLGGHDVCREIRARSDVIIIIISREPDPTEQRIALAIGADHYLPVDTPMPVVLANIAALLRRRRGALVPRGLAAAAEHPAAHRPAGRLTDGDLGIDLDAREVRVAGRVVALTRTEFDLLVLLMRRPTQVLTHDQLLSEVRGDLLSSPHLLHTHLSRLRTKVAAAGGERLAHAVRGVGYRLRP